MNNKTVHVNKNATRTKNKKMVFFTLAKIPETRDMYNSHLHL